MSRADQAAAPRGRAEVWVVEAAPGRARRGWLETAAAGARDDGAQAFVLDVAFEEGGPWAGVRDLLGGLIETLRRDHPALVTRHADELAYVLPELKHVLGARHQTLTDLAPPEEKVRNYPADRAYRVVHGIIDLLDAYQARTAAEQSWVLLCDNFDGLSHIGRRFFRELVRRRGAALRLRLVAAVAPGAGDRNAALFDFVPGGVQRLAPRLAELPAEPLDRAALLARVEELEAFVGRDKDRIEVHVVELLRAARLLGDERRRYRWVCWGLDIFNSLGFYEDALTYGYEAWRTFHAGEADNEDLLWSLFNKLFMSNVGLQRSDDALRVVEEGRILERPIGHGRRAQLYYLMAMLHVRYMSAKDLARGEKYLEDGLEHLVAARSSGEMSEEDFHFYFVFNRNGLALVRHFQGRFDEAIELCSGGYARLHEHLAGEKHKLHRSVLLYNIGQVYSTIGALDDAVRYYTAAMEMDPAYSEYYNDRGSLYLRLGRFEEAKADYLRGIELSPPYHEVWTNLGQCHRQAGELPEAAAAYSHALDLNPDNPVALAGRAEALEALGRFDEALHDYDRAVELRPKRWETLASRALLRHQTGDSAGALGDLERAVELAPQQAGLYLNRAVALVALGHTERALADLQSYLSLAPDASDRADAERWMQELQGVPR